MNRDVAVEVAICKRKSILAVADDRLDPRMVSPNLLRHVLPQLDGEIVRSLLGRERLVAQVLAHTGTDLDGPAEARTRVSHREGVVEALDQPVTPRQDLMPALDEIIIGRLLLAGERLQRLGPCL